MTMKDEGCLKRIENSVRSILDEFEIDKKSEMYRNTPNRVARLYIEIFGVWPNQRTQNDAF